MTEELNNFCTDLKDLFMQQDFEQMEKQLAVRDDEEVRELAVYQHDILAKYYGSHLNFVAFASYLFEYAGGRGVFLPAEFKQGFQVFLDIYELAKNRK